MVIRQGHGLSQGLLLWPEEKSFSYAVALARSRARESEREREKARESERERDVGARIWFIIYILSICIVLKYFLYAHGTYVYIVLAKIVLIFHVLFGADRVAEARGPADAIGLLR
jgi:hypothetical protein